MLLVSFVVVENCLSFLFSLRTDSTINNWLNYRYRLSREGKVYRHPQAQKIGSNNQQQHSNNNNGVVMDWCAHVSLRGRFCAPREKSNGKVRDARKRAVGGSQPTSDNRSDKRQRRIRITMAVLRSHCGSAQERKDAEVKDYNRGILTVDYFCFVES